MNLITEKYSLQNNRWPQTGRHIMAQYDDQSIIVYQAYRPSIGNYAAQHKHFGGEFSFERMSWIKPNFLWMMYRCGWGTKEGQELILAIRLKREGFDEILRRAVHSNFEAEVYPDQASWQRAVKTSPVRLQWDPDHNPSGNKVERRAIQLGLRGEILKFYAREWIIDIEDISEFVRKEREHASGVIGRTELLTPRETIYPIADPVVAAKLGISQFELAS